MTRIAILGGPGDGAVVAQAIHDMAAAGHLVALSGFLNDKLSTGTLVHGFPVLGTLTEWRKTNTETRFISALHKVKQMESRSRRILELAIPEDRWISVIHPTARIANDVQIGYGSFLGQYVVVQPGARIGHHVSVRAGANIGHDAVLEDFTYMGPNSTLCGRAILLKGAHLGPNAVVVDHKRVGCYAVVGVCSAVTKNVPDREVCFGLPARKIEKLLSVKT
jgi:sugar O-acyltransferase (sialic acid O-acetyltransferase NeuD family)